MQNAISFNIFHMTRTIQDSGVVFTGGEGDTLRNALREAKGGGA